MEGVTRKDYGAEAIVDHSNETLRRVRNQNAPYSPQSTGILENKDKYLEMTSANLDALTTNTRFIQGNREGHVKTVTDDGAVAPAIPVLVSAELAWSRHGVEFTETLTKEDLLSSTNIFFLKTE